MEKGVVVLTIEAVEILTESGELVTVRRAVRITYKKICPYLDHPFETPEQSRVYCCDSHKSMFDRKHRPN